DTRMKEAQFEYAEHQDIENTNILFFSKYPLGSAVMAFYDLDKKWNRGKILEYVGAKQAKICFVDYGNTEIISLCYILPMKEKFIAGIPQQAIPILMNVEDQDFLLKFNLSLLREQLVHRVIKCIFSYRLVSNEYQATLITINGKDMKVFLTDNLSTGMEKLNENSDKIGLSGRYTHRFSLASIIAKKIGGENSDSKIIIKDELKKGKSVQVYVSHVDNDNSFWVQRLHGADKLSNIMEKLQNKMSENYATSELSTPSIGQFCVCKFSLDGDWYRAKVIDISKTQEITVQYIDYGNNEKLENSKTYQLPDECTKLPAQAIHCCLSNFPNYTKEDMLVLNSLIKENALIYIKSNESFDDMNVLITVSNQEIIKKTDAAISIPQKSSFSASNENDIVNNSNPSNSVTTSETTRTTPGIDQAVSLTSKLEQTCEDSLVYPIMAKDMAVPVPLLSENVVYIVHTEADEGQVWLQRAEDTSALTILQGCIDNSVESQQ
ncbi:unnamed protein product, partial [Meganyctiphanes norvegica]